MNKRIKTNMSASLLVMIAYILLVLSKITRLTDISGDNEYIGVILLQILIFLLPAVIYSKLRGEDFPTKLRIRLAGAEALVLALFAAITLVLGSLILNIAFADGLRTDEFTLYNTYSASHDGSAESFLRLTVAYAALPAVCEEFFFRSLLCADYEDGGTGCALIMSSLFFGMIHFNFAQLPVYFFAGLVLALTMYAARSVAVSVLVHFLFNMYGLFGQKFISEVYRTTGSTELFMMLIISIFLLSLMLFCGEASRLYRRYAKNGIKSEYVRGKRLRKNTRKKNGEILVGRAYSLTEALLAPPCLICYLIFVFVTAFL